MVIIKRTLYAKIVSVICIIVLLASMCTNVFAEKDAPDNVNASNGQEKEKYLAATVAAEASDEAQQLGITQQQYEQLRQMIKNNLLNVVEEYDFSDYKIVYTSENSHILWDLISDDPEAIYFDNCSIWTDGTYLTSIVVKMTVTEQRAKEMLAECHAAADAFIAEFENKGLSDLEKALLLHDKLALNCEYDYDNVLAGTLPNESYNMYGALINKICVCQGYAFAYQYMLTKLGVECSFCSSKEHVHAWNVVKIDGKYYHVDVTHDDIIYDIPGYVAHDNFLCSTNKKAAELYSSDGVNIIDFDTRPTDTAYDDYFWTNSESAFILFNGKIYYIDCDEAHNGESATLNRWDGNEDVVKLASVKDTWKYGTDSYWPGNYSRLSADDKFLYYNTSTDIYKYDPVKDKTKVVYTPELPDNKHYIYGFKAENDYFYCTLNDSPYFDSDTVATKTDACHYDNEMIGYKEKKVIVGDVDGDGKVTPTDRMILARYIAKWSGYENMCDLNAADIDRDGKVTPTDRMILARYIAKWNGYEEYFIDKTTGEGIVLPIHVF